MKTSAENPLSRLNHSLGLAFALVTLLAVPPAGAQIITLTDNNSTTLINTTNQAGMFDWTVDGQNQLFQQWFWYRVGLVPEASIDTISAPAIVMPNPRQATITYANLVFSVRLDYTLSGGAPGSQISQVTELIRIDNLSGALLDMHFFQYSDFDLGNTAGNDTVQLGLNGAGKFNEAFQSEPGIAFTEVVNTPGADRGEVDFYNNTLIKLSNGFADNLNNVAGPLGPGDVTWALQWDFLIQPGGSAIISKVKTLDIIFIPEPGSWVLLFLGLGAVAASRFCRGRRN